MLAILSAPGSRGDVNPMVAIGKELRQRGFEVVVSLAQPYQNVAEDAGLQTEPVISTELFDEMLSDPDVWKPIRGVRRILSRVAAEFLPRHDAVIRKHHRPGETVLVSHPLDFASRVFRETDASTPLVDVHLAPATLRVPSSPARLTPWWFEISRPTWAVKTAYWIADRWILDPALESSLGEIRSHYGLPKVRRYLNEWWMSPDCILAMFPKWFAPETTRVADHLTHVGFPLEDFAVEDQETPQLQQKIEETRPIVFTAGTAHHHCLDFFRRCVESCVRLDRPGLLLSTHVDNIPRSLPRDIIHATYAPMAAVLQGASAIVHHGGIGTTSQSLAAGVPQIIRPNAFDQFDNAARIERIGCGKWLRGDHQLTSALSNLLKDASIATCCIDRSTQMGTQTQRGAETAADEICRLMKRR